MHDRTERHVLSAHSLALPAGSCHGREQLVALPAFVVVLAAALPVVLASALTRFFEVLAGGGRSVVEDLVPLDGPVQVETLQPPQAYSPRQLELACGIAQAFGRGVFVLLEPPKCP